MSGYPEYLFSGRNRLNKRLRNKFIYLFLDYDGTLAPIAKTPGKAKLPKEAKKALRRLSERPDCKLAVISGRALADIKGRVGVKGIVYVGNHGLEIDAPRLKFRSPLGPRYRHLLEEIKKKLHRQLCRIRGVFIEDKGLSLSVHYRLADKRRILEIKNIFYGTLILYEVRNNVKVNTGKMMLEVRPPVNWNKGSVVLWLLARQRSFARNPGRRELLPIYLGDDVTDEDAFRALEGGGWTIFVGTPKKSEARYYLKDTGQVVELLNMILKRKQDIRRGTTDSG